jgi:CobQ-like glutamine amidotransferase family enzyme
VTDATLNIGLVLPDVLGTYGDDGNALVLRQRARMRGITAEIHPITLGDGVPGDARRLHRRWWRGRRPDPRR